MNCYCNKKKAHFVKEILFDGGSESSDVSLDDKDSKYKCRKGHKCEVRTNDKHTILSKCPLGHPLKFFDKTGYDGRTRCMMPTVYGTC